MANEVDKPQSMHADWLITPRSSQNTRKSTFKYVEAEKQSVENVEFRHLSLLFLVQNSTGIAYQLKMDRG